MSNASHILTNGHCPRCEADEFTILWRPLVRCHNCGKLYKLKRPAAPSREGEGP